MDPLTTWTTSTAREMSRRIEDALMAASAAGIAAVDVRTVAAERGVRLEIQPVATLDAPPTWPDCDRYPAHP